MPFNVPPWIPLNDPRLQKTIGKTGEETVELAKVLFRIGIQGLDEINPSTGKSNRQELIEEITDVYCQLGMLHEELGVTVDEIRFAKKTHNQRRWLNDMNVEGNTNAN